MRLINLTSRPVFSGRIARMILPLLASACLTVPAAPLSSAEEIADLKRRVSELETQNRRLAELMAALEARMQPAPAAAARPAAPAQATATPARGPKKMEAAPDAARLAIYGMLRLDMDIDSQRPNSPQTPLFITSPSGAKSGSFALHPRLTRIGLDVTGPRLQSLGNAEFSGKLETDFENGGSESRQIIRIRHAYLKSTWKDFSILAGQTWDVFSPLFPSVNNDTLMWNAGNVGDRRPQIRAAYEPKVGQGQVSFAGAVGLTGAVDALDIDNDGYLDGIQSARPDVQSRLGYSGPLWVANQAFSVGGSVFQGWLGVVRPIGGRTLLPAQGYNADFTLPLARLVSLRGEGWWGRNMSDFRGGAGQGVTLANGRVVRGRGGWAELKLQVYRRWAMAPGFTTDNPVKADLVRGSRARNRAFYVGNRFSAGGKVEFGVDYFRWRTDYIGLLSGFNNRWNAFFQYGF